VVRINDHLSIGTRVSIVTICGRLSVRTIPALALLFAPVASRRPTAAVAELTA
jgi:hypothetical protein